MIDLSQYILEGIFDEPTDTEFRKQIIDEIKVWSKNIYKRNGRIKVDSKTGKITLPETWMEIQCPIPQGASFDIIKNATINLINATDEDLLKFSNCQIDNTSEIIIKRGTVSYVPKYMENVGEVSVFVDGDLDISEINNIYPKLGAEIHGPLYYYYIELWHVIRVFCDNFLLDIKRTILRLKNCK